MSLDTSCGGTNDVGTNVGRHKCRWAQVSAAQMTRAQMSVGIMPVGTNDVWAQMSFGHKCRLGTKVGEHKCQ